MDIPDIPLTSEADAAPRRRRRQDGGFTFVETVITVVLMGVVIVPILAAVRGAIRASAVTESAAAVETVLVNAADRVQQAANTCDLSGDALAAKPADWPTTSMTVSQAWLDVNSGQWLPGAPATLAGGGPACPSTGNTNELVKRVTITVTSPNGAITRRIQVVKSNV